MTRRSARSRRSRRRRKRPAQQLARDVRKDPAALELLTLLANGTSPREAAVALGCPNHTVDNRLRGLRRFFGAKTTTHLVAIAISTGVIPPAAELLSPVARRGMHHGVRRRKPVKLVRDQPGPLVQQESQDAWSLPESLESDYR